MKRTVGWGTGLKGSLNLFRHLAVTGETSGICYTLLNDDNIMK